MNTNQDKATAKNLDIAYLEGQISQAGWLSPIIHEQVTSTNEVVQSLFDSVEPASGVVVIANEQTHGRGRLERNWSTPAGSGIAMSLGISTSDFDVPINVMPLLTGLAVHRALAKLNILADLKWPNDIVFANSKIAKSETASLRKTGGILVQLFGNKLVIGIGINVSLTAEELPVETATSLLLEGFDVSREELMIQVLEELKNLRSENEYWLEEYQKACATLGQKVRVINSDSSELVGEAVSIDETGAINILSLGNLYQITVGDIEHLQVLAD